MLEQILMWSLGAMQLCVSGLAWMMWQKIKATDQSLASLAQQTDARFQADMEARRGIHKDIARIETTCMTREECGQREEKVAAQMSGFHEAVLKLERVSERADMALGRGESVLEQIIVIEREVAELTGWVRHMSDHHAQGPAPSRENPK